MDFPGEKVLTRLIEALENGIGGALRPWQIKRVEKASAEARVLERLLLEQVERDISDLRAGRKKLDSTGRLITCDVPKPILLECQKPIESTETTQLHSAVQAFALATQDSSVAQELQRTVNLKRAALYAEEAAEELDRQTEDGRPSAAPQRKVDTDWFAKWRNGAQEVSRDEMQRLWGKILANEVAQPGAYSLHTIDFLSRMSFSDADLLARIAPFTTCAGIIKAGDEFFERQGLKFSDFLYLDDLGLINGTIGIGGLLHPMGNKDHNGRAISMLRCVKRILIFDMGESGKFPPELTLPIFSLTRVAREILSLTSITENEEYLKEICDMAVSKGAIEAQVGTLHANGVNIMNPKVLATRSDLPPKAD